MASSEIRLPPKWIELNLRKRECVLFIPDELDEAMCQCGRGKSEHSDLAQRHHDQTTWIPSVHTRASPTDAYGTMVFEGEHYPNKSHYVRLSYDTNPELVVQLMTLVWGIPMPKLVITVRGGNSNFEIPPRLGKLLQRGLVKAARTTGAWILSNGLNKGAARHVGAALASDRVTGLKRGRVISLGIAPWGVVENRNVLLGHNKEKTYNVMEQVASKYLLLNPRHSNFLLVDNGSVGKLGGESFFRKRFEKCISSYPTSPNRGCDTPIVCVVVEGGCFTLRNIGDYLYDEPPVPVVIFSGTGKTADLIALVLKRLNSGSQLENIQDEIFAWMVKLYNIKQSQCGILFNEVKRIVSKRNLITVYSPSSSEEEDFDVILLASIFRSQHWTLFQQLSLTLVWDRVDIATNEVFIYGKDWSKEHLEIAMMEALVSDRLEFVYLLLEHGLNLQTFLTPARLEALYSMERTHSKPMRSLLYELAKIRATQKKFAGSKPMYDRNLTLHDIGIAMSHMMGHIYKSKYIGIKISQQTKDGDIEPDDNATSLGFPQPFDDLFVWAVLTKRHSMALLLWGHGPGALAKALVAVKLNKYLANELETAEKIETNMAAEFRIYSEEWENLSLELLDLCFKSDAKMARQLLTMELEHWSGQTCLTLGVMSNHRTLLGHPCCQMLLADLWMGALNLRRHATAKIVLGIVCPPMALCWEYKTRDELKLLPHQERHLHGNLVYNSLTHDEYLVDSESLRTYTRSRGSFSSSIFKNHKKKHDTKSHQRFREHMNNYPGVVHVDEGAEVMLESPTSGRAMSSQPMKAKRREHRNHHVTIMDKNASEIWNYDNEQPVHMRKPVHPSFEQQSSYVTTRQDLKPWKKFWEFQNAPVTNFYRHMLAYVIFACCLGYVILIPQDRERAGQVEIYVITYLATLGCDSIREFVNIDAYNLSLKWQEFRTNIWMISDFSVIVFFMIGVTLRFQNHVHEDFFNYGFLLYRVSSIYWNLRLYKYMGVHKFVGPKIVMMSRMLKHMAYFAMIIVVVLIAFGIARESIRFPDENPSWRNMAEALLEPYVMLFGEVDADELSPQCGEEGQKVCPVGMWIIPLTWIIYMMVANILIVNVLIAVFNGIYAEVDAIALELWMFQRFTFVMEFEQKPILPPPLIAICHTYYILRWMYNKCFSYMCEEELPEKTLDDDGRNVITSNDHALKIFLTAAEVNVVFDFESDNLDSIGLGIKRYTDVRGIKNNFQSDNQPAGPTGKADVKGIAHIQSNINDLFMEIESQRIKLDKLITLFESNNEAEKIQ